MLPASEGLRLPTLWSRNLRSGLSSLVSRYPRRMVVVYAIITTEGKLERMHIMETPNAEISQPLLEALAKWVFRPAELDGQTVSLKALFGIPLWLSE